MSKRIFSVHEMRQLSENTNVARVSERSITFKNLFKRHAVARNAEGMPPQEIFRQAGFDLGVIGREQPKRCLKRWNKTARARGVNSLIDSRGKHHKGGRPPKPVFKNEKEKLKYLEAQVAYLKAENAFLAKLRKQRLNYGQAGDIGSFGR
jgi:hypothetical protein